MGIDPDVEERLIEIEARLAALEPEPPPESPGMVWVDVDGGTLVDGQRARPGIIGWDADRAPVEGQGVEFFINAQPNRVDKTGPPASQFHIHPPVTLHEGDRLEARWVTAGGLEQVEEFRVPPR